jgi:HK97 family phage prohead protease
MSKKKSNPNVMETVRGKFEFKGIDGDTDQEYYIVSGYATKFFGVDTYGDTIVPGAYDQTIKENPTGFPAFVMHKSHDMPVGLWTSFKEDREGLFVEAKLPKADTFVTERLIPQIKLGSVDSLSIGYYPVKVRFEEDDTRTLLEIGLKEISFITKGYQADSGALLTELKKVDGCSDEETYFNGRVDAIRKETTPELKTEIKEFYHQKGLNDPFGEDSVLSTEELQTLSKSNLAYSIRELKLSANASNYLAGLVLTSKSDETDPKGEEGSTVEAKKEETEGTVPTVTEDELEKKSMDTANNSLADLIKSLKK